MIKKVTFLFNKKGIYIYIYIYILMRELYTNVPHKERTEAVKQQLKKLKPRITIKVNNFVFNDINYLQKKSCTMGTIYAPS